MKTKQVLLSILLLMFIQLTTSCKKKEAVKDVTETKPELIHKKTNDVISKKYPSVNIKANQKITSPLKIKVNSLGIWSAFEGEIGTVRLYGAANKQLGNVGILHVSDGVDWMVEGNVPFDATITFEAGKSSKGKLVFDNNNPGEGDDKSFEIPVQF
ncbi:MAG: hypothetical protein V3U80_04540 [Flavobacteriaceae bacterium]